MGCPEPTSQRRVWSEAEMPGLPPADKLPSGGGPVGRVRLTNLNQQSSPTIPKAKAACSFARKAFKN